MRPGAYRSRVREMEVFPGPSSAEVVVARDGLALVSSRWGLAVLEELSVGRRRFNDLQRSLPGISHRVLAATLRRCVAQAVVERVDHHTNPPHVDYCLTDVGRALLTTIWGFCAWGAKPQGMTRP